MGSESDSSDSDITVVDEISVDIRFSNGSTFSVSTALNFTVAEFKSVLARRTDVPAEQQRLIYKGWVLKDDRTLDSYGLQADHTIHMVRGFSRAASNPPSAPANSGIPDTTPVTARTAGIPDTEQMPQQLNQNPNMMRNIMNMPAIQRLMNSPRLLEFIDRNPDIMSVPAIQRLMKKPQMREIIDRNPELGHVLNDPSLLRQIVERIRNPELRRERMRITDRAMRKIESSPKGFNMLRRKIESSPKRFNTVRRNATTMGGDAGNNNLIRFGTRLGTQGAADGQQRDGSSSPSTTGAESGGPNTHPLPNPWNNTPKGRGTRIKSAQRRLPPLRGLDRLPESDQMLGGAPNPPSMSQMMQNPAMAQMRQSPVVAQMMQDPVLAQTIHRALSDPEYMSQQMMSPQPSLLSPMNPSQTNTDPLQTGGAAGNYRYITVTVRFSAVPPDGRFATQLAQLQEMGFIDAQENIRALEATRGNVHAAVKHLLGNKDQ